MATLAPPNASPELHSAAIYTNCTQTPENAVKYQRLMVVQGISGAYQQGLLTAQEARNKINLVLSTGEFQGTEVGRGLHDALLGAPIDVAKYSDYAALGIGVASAFFPLSSIAAGTLALGTALTTSTLKEYPEFINSEYSPFARPAEWGVVQAGVYATEAFSTLRRTDQMLNQLTAQYLPTSGLPLTLGENFNQTVARLSPEDRKIITDLRNQVMQGDLTLKTSIKQLSDRLEVTIEQGKELQQYIRDQKREEARILQEKMQREYDRREIEGGVTLAAFAIGAFISPVAARQFVGIAKGVGAIQGLFKDIIGKQIGPLAFAGGIASAIQGIFSLFGPSQDEILMERLGEISKKLDVLLDVVQKGFQHLDAKLTEVLKLCQEILREVQLGNLDNRTRLKDLDAKVSDLLSLLEQVTISNREADVTSALNRYSNYMSGRYRAQQRGEIWNRNDPLDLVQYNEAEDAVWRFSNFCHEKPHAKLYESSDPSVLLDNLATISAFKAGREISYQIAYLPQVLRSVPSRTLSSLSQKPFLPNPTKWCATIHALCELQFSFRRNPYDNFASTMLKIWNEGNVLRHDLLSITAPYVFRYLNKYLHSVLLRGDSYVKDNLESRLHQFLSDFITQHPTRTKFLTAITIEINDSNQNLSKPFEARTIAARFALALYEWKSNVPGPLAANFDGLQWLDNRKSLAAFTYSVADAFPNGTLTDDEWVAAAVKKIMVQYRQRVKEQLLTFEQIADSKEVQDRKYNAGPLDEVLKQLATVLHAFKVTIPASLAPPTGLDRSWPAFEDTDTLDAKGFQNFLRDILKKVPENFDSLAVGRDVDSFGYTLCDALPPVLNAKFVRKEPTRNALGRLTHFALDLPAPLNPPDALRQFLVYQKLIMETLEHTKVDDLVLENMRRFLPADSKIQKIVAFTMHPKWGHPFHACILTYSTSGTPTRVDLNVGGVDSSFDDNSSVNPILRLWVFTKESCGLVIEP